MEPQIYTVVGRMERRTYSDEPERRLGRIMLLLISRNDGEDVRWIEIEDVGMYENCIIGESVIFDGERLWQEGLYPELWAGFAVV